MSQGFLDKLKKTVIAGAATSAAKVEEAAKTGKLHLDLLNEKRKLSTQFTKLGELTYQKTQDSTLDSLVEEAEFIKLIGAVSEIKTSIAELELKLKDSDIAKTEPESEPTEEPIKDEKE